MSHFAKVENGIVTQVIVIEQDVLASGLWGDPASWVQTSYNTYGGGVGLVSIVNRITYATDTATASVRGPLSATRYQLAAAGGIQ